VWKNPLVVGASGQLGVELCRALRDGGSSHVVRSGRTSATGELTLDLARILTLEDAAAAVDPVRPDLILCAGAMTFVDGCEEHPDQAVRINTYGPSALAAYAHSCGIPFVYFSSDYVFAGAAEQPGPYAEDAKPDPVSVYGRTKLEGERAILRVHPEALVIRTSWVYGPDAAGKNFVSSLLRQLRAGERVRVPSDQISTPTFNRDLARVTLRLTESGMHGVIHVTGPELMSRLELAQAVARFFGLDGGLVEGVATAGLGQRAQRPLLSGLISQRLHEVGAEGRMRTLREGLEQTAASLLT
jgi:dTDP-4-dehydrorhamnose reductase